MKLTKMQFLKNKAHEAIGESVSFIDSLERVYNKTRGQRNTAALITAAKKHKGCIVTHTVKWADQLRKDHNVDAMVYSDPKIWQYQGPILFDMPAMFEFVKAHSRLLHATQELLEFMDLKNVD